MVFRERTLINSMLSMAPNIVFAANRTQNTDTERKTQTQLISALECRYDKFQSYSFVLTLKICKFRSVCNRDRRMIGCFSNAKLYETLTYVPLSTICPSCRTSI